MRPSLGTAHDRSTVADPPTPNAADGLLRPANFTTVLSRLADAPHSRLSAALTCSPVRAPVESTGSTRATPPEGIVTVSVTTPDVPPVTVDP